MNYDFELLRVDCKSTKWCISCFYENVYLLYLSQILFVDLGHFKVQYFIYYLIVAICRISIVYIFSLFSTLFLSVWKCPGFILFSMHINVEHLIWGDIFLRGDMTFYAQGHNALNSYQMRD